MILHDRKNPHCEACQRGRMVRRYTHSVRSYDEKEPVRTAYGEIDGISRASGKESTPAIRDRYSGVVAVYPMASRAELNNYEALKHFGGTRLKGRTETAFRSDAATELQAAASRMCWTVSSALPDSFRHNAHVERERG